MARPRDSQKKRRIYEAAIDQINDTGFDGASISKIAQRAKVSVGTIYIYFENKEDMLNKLYMDVKKEIAEQVFQVPTSQTLCTQTVLLQVWDAYLQYLLQNPQKFTFVDQFASSPKIHELSHQEVRSGYEEIRMVLLDGKKEKILKNLHNLELVALYLGPIHQLWKSERLGSSTSSKTRSQIRDACWDAIAYRDF